MKTLIVILIFLSFFQASVLPLNLGLILILTRAFIRQDRANLILALTFGFLLSFLEHLPLGLISLMFIVFVEAIYLWNKTPFSRNALTVLPVVGLVILVVDLFSGPSTIWPRILLELVLILPIYLAVRFWEERFIAAKQIKLKI